MEFGTELKNFLMIAIKRSWVIILCVLVCVCVAVPIGKNQYSAAQKVVAEHNDVVDVYKNMKYECMTLLKCSTESENATDFSYAVNVSKYFADSKRKNEILKSLNSELNVPVDFMTFNKMFLVTGAGSMSELVHITVTAQDAQDAKKINDFLVNMTIENFDDIYEEDSNVTVSVVDSGERIKSADEMNAFVERLRTDYNIKVINPPSLASVLGSTLKLFAIAGALIGCSIILIWNGISPCVGDVKSACAKYGVAAYGVLKAKDVKKNSMNANIVTENMRVDYDSDSFQKIVGISLYKRSDLKEVAVFLEGRIEKSVVVAQWTDKNVFSVCEGADAILVIAKPYVTRQASVEELLNVLKKMKCVNVSILLVS
ncbi:MAG: hypothetical protein RSC25_07450 [Christensenella sp.]